MKSDFVIAIAQLSAEKNLDSKTVFEAVEAAMASAFKKDDLQYADIEVAIDVADGEITARRRYLVMADADMDKAVDALIGSEIGDEDPLVALAKLETVELDIGGDLNVLANMQASLSASTSNKASSETAGAAASMVLATNRSAPMRRPSSCSPKTVGPMPRTWPVR